MYIKKGVFKYDFEHQCIAHAELHCNQRIWSEISSKEHSTCFTSDFECKNVLQFVYKAVEREHPLAAFIFSLDRLTGL